MTLRRIRGGLLALVVLTALPALTVIGIAGMSGRDATLERERVRLAELARAVGLGQQRIIERAEQLLVTLEVVLARPTDREPSACLAFLADLSAADPLFGSIGVADTHGRVVCADAPTLVGRDLAGTRMFGEAVGVLGLTVGALTTDPDGTAVLPLGRPLHTADGTDDGLVFVTLPLHQLAGAAVDLGLPPDARVDLLDADGRLLLRYPDPGGFAGRQLVDEPLAQAARAARGSDAVVDLDGVTRTYGFSRLAGGAQELLVAVGRPTQAIVAAAGRVTNVALLGVAALAILTLLIGWTVGTRLLIVPHAAAVDRSLRDPLTGLHNRRHLVAEAGRLERERAADRRPRGWVAAILFDLDHFGTLNKRHGHAYGDLVLREFAAVLRERFRDGDIVARLGGEEFAAVLEVRNPRDAVHIANEVRERFAARARVIAQAGHGVVTVSAGVAGTSDAVLSIDQLLAEADERLRRSKLQGRDRVTGPDRAAPTVGGVGGLRSTAAA